MHYQQPSNNPRNHYTPDNNLNHSNRSNHSATPSKPTRKRKGIRFSRKRLRDWTMFASMTLSQVMHSSAANAVFFEKGQTYADEVFPLAAPLTLILIGGLRLLVIYLVGSKAVKIISGSRGDDKIGDLAMEIVIILLAVFGVDILLDIVLP